MMLMPSADHWRGLTSAIHQFRKRAAKAAKRMIGRLLCLFGRHDWVFTLNFVQPPDYDQPCVAHDGFNHYSGECRRGCDSRNLFRGPYRPEDGRAEKRED